MSSEKNKRAAKHLVILGLLLQALHVLFGITAIIGMLINHTLIHVTNDTVYKSQIRWQLVTFWVAACLYALAIFAWIKLDIIWPFIPVLLFCIYRIVVCAYYCKHDQEMDRLI